MTKFYSKETKGFYSDDLHDKMPEDAVQITDETYAQLLAGQETGKVISADKDGNPILIDRKPPSKEEKAKRDIMLLEAEITPRRIREAVLGDKAWLIEQEAKISALRATL